MFWVLKRTVWLRWFFWVPTTYVLNEKLKPQTNMYVKTYGYENVQKFSVSLAMHYIHVRIFDYRQSSNIISFKKAMGILPSVCLSRYLLDRWSDFNQICYVLSLYPQVVHEHSNFWSHPLGRGQRSNIWKMPFISLILYTFTTNSYSGTPDSLVL